MPLSNIHTKNIIKHLQNVVKKCPSVPLKANSWADSKVLMLIKFLCVLQNKLLGIKTGGENEKGKRSLRFSFLGQEQFF